MSLFTKKSQFRLCPPAPGAANNSGSVWIVKDIQKGALVSLRVESPQSQNKWIGNPVPGLGIVGDQEFVVKRAPAPGPTTVAGRTFRQPVITLFDNVSNAPENTSRGLALDDFAGGPIGDVLVPAGYKSYSLQMRGAPGTTPELPDANRDWLYARLVGPTAVVAEVFDTGDGILTKFKAKLASPLVTPGSVAIATTLVTAGVIALTDVYGDGRIVGEGIQFGFIDYGSGELTLDFGTDPVAAATDIEVDYENGTIFPLDLSAEYEHTNDQLTRVG